jgi:hypothetical protein
MKSQITTLSVAAGAIFALSLASPTAEAAQNLRYATWDPPIMKCVNSASMSGSRASEKSRRAA